MARIQISQNNFSGVAYVTVGGFCLFLALLFVVLYMIKPRYNVLFLSDADAFSIILD